MLCDPATVKIHTKLVSFEVNHCQSSYKDLFQGTSLGTALSRMSSEKVAPRGLKHQECEHGRGGGKAPIQYVPERELVQEAFELKPESLKCTLANGSETQVTVWSRHSVNKQFLLHVNKAYSVAKNMGLLSAFDDPQVAHGLKKGNYKAVLAEHAKIKEAVPCNEAEAEKKSAKSCRQSL